MILELLASLVSGFALAGVVMLLRLIFKDRLPRWSVPAAAGLGMLSFAVWNEYDWVKRAEATLPDGVHIAWTNEEQAAWRPWTFLAPITTRFMAVDARNPRTHPQAPDQVIVRVVMMGRFVPGAEFPVVFDCAEGRSAELIDDRVRFEEDGRIEGAVWRDLPLTDPVLRTACDGG
jgi:hypothetical protein